MGFKCKGPDNVVETVKWRYLSGGWVPAAAICSLDIAPELRAVTEAPDFVLSSEDLVATQSWTPNDRYWTYAEVKIGESRWFKPGSDCSCETPGTSRANIDFGSLGARSGQTVGVRLRFGDGLNFGKWKSKTTVLSAYVAPAASGSSSSSSVTVGACGLGCAEPGFMKAQTEEPTQCPAGCCKHENWFCCPDNICCAMTAEQCPGSFSSGTTTIDGVAINLNYYFDMTQTLFWWSRNWFSSEEGVAVPAGDSNLLVYVSEGRVITQPVSEGQEIGFGSKSKIVIGKANESSTGAISWLENPCGSSCLEGEAYSNYSNLYLAYPGSVWTPGSFCKDAYRPVDERPNCSSSSFAPRCLPLNSSSSCAKKCAGGCCSEPGWVCCPDGTTCADSTLNCPKSARVYGGSYQFGGTAIVLADYFNSGSPVLSYTGPSGGMFVVPSGYNHAVFIDSYGNVTEESVEPGQTLTFRSGVALGNRNSREIWTCDANKGCIKIVGIIGGELGFGSKQACEEGCCEIDQGFGFASRYENRRFSCNPECASREDICSRPHCGEQQCKDGCNPSQCDCPALYVDPCECIDCGDQCCELTPNPDWEVGNPNSPENLASCKPCVDCELCLQWTGDTMNDPNGKFICPCTQGLEICCNGTCIDSRMFKCCGDGLDAYECYSDWTCCGGNCCDVGTFCCGDGNCCSFASEDKCINGECCPLDRQCGEICCPEGQRCVGGKCCPQSRVCESSGGVEICCEATEECLIPADGGGFSCCPSERQCDGQCCPEGERCVQGKKGGERDYCCPNSRATSNINCCPEGETACGTFGSAICCPDNRVCCEGTCCPDGEICEGGVCRPQSSSSTGSSSTSENWYYQKCPFREADCSEAWTCDQGPLPGGFSTYEECSEANPDEVPCPDPFCETNEDCGDECCVEGCCQPCSSSSSNNGSSSSSSSSSPSVFSNFLWCNSASEQGGACSFFPGQPDDNPFSHVWILTNKVCDQVYCELCRTQSAIGPCDSCTGYHQEETTCGSTNDYKSYMETLGYECVSHEVSAPFGTCDVAVNCCPRTMI